MEPLEFTHAQMIGPDLPGTWPGDFEAPVYWMARTEFELPAQPAQARLAVVADRHYQIYLNGRHVADQHGFFNGDQYLVGQTWTDMFARGLQQGRNVLELLIRSDPYCHKNHRTFAPMLMAEGCVECDGCADTMIATSVDTWQVAVISGWRELVGTGSCYTLPWDRIYLSVCESMHAAGMSQDIPWGRAVVVDVSGPVPPVYEWNDYPERLRDRMPGLVVQEGPCVLPEYALVADLGAETALREEDVHSDIVLEGTFHCQEPVRLQLGGSALIDYTVELNDQTVADVRGVPDRQQMSLIDYISLIGSGMTRVGENRIRITVHRHRGCNKKLYLTCDGVDTRDIEWQCTGNGSGVWERHTLSTAERVGSLFPGNALSESRVFDARGGLDIVMPTQDASADCYTVVLDMQETIRARPALRISAQGPGRIYMGFGFSAHNGTVDCTRMLRTAVEVLEVPAGESVYRSFDLRTFRYVVLVCEGFTGPVHVRDIRATQALFVDNEQTGWQCTDERLNAIYDASRRTGQICHDELIVDNTEREHAQWADPIYSVCLTDYFCFGAYRRARRPLEEMMLAQIDDGQLPGYTPGRWFPRRPIQSHTNLVADTMVNHYMHTADETFGRRALDCIRRMIAFWGRFRNRDGLLAEMHTTFVDWGYCRYSYLNDGEGPVGILTAQNALYVYTLGHAARLARWLGATDLADEWKSLARQTAAGMCDVLYKPDLGVFVDGADNAQAEHTISQVANCAAIRAGVAPVGQAEQIVRRSFEPVEGYDYLYCNALFAPVAAEAMFENGCADLAIEWIRRRFGEMIDFGSDTIWETFEPMASHCQGTGAGIAYVLHRYTGGIYPAQPGYAQIGLDPRLGTLDEVRSTVMTIHGPVTVETHQRDDKVSCRLTLPSELQNRKIIHGDHVSVEVQ